jgi:hypothetical protein
MFSLKHNCIVTIKFMGVQINDYEAVYLYMRRNRFAFVVMLVIATALMCSIIPSERIESVYAEEDESTHNNDSEENQNQHDGDESDNGEDGDNARSPDDDGGDEDENDDESSRSQDDNGEDGDNARSQDDDGGDEDENDDESSRSQDDDSGDGDEEGDDSSKTETEQESEQKNVCSGWAVCINVATNPESSTIGGGLAAQTESEIPMLLSLPL